jgi:hypothetical protein
MPDASAEELAPGYMRVRRTESERQQRFASLAATAVLSGLAGALNINISPVVIAEAIKTGVETFAQVGLRRKQAELESRGHELELEITALEAQQTAAMRQQEAELQDKERQLARLEMELEIERKRLEVERTRLEIVTQQLELRVHAVEAANEMIALLYPDANSDTRQLLTQSLVPSLLQLTELAPSAEVAVGTSTTRDVNIDSPETDTASQ